MSWCLIYCKARPQAFLLHPLLFPEHPYHRLVKDDKLLCDQMNNPVNDCQKAKDLLFDEILCWHRLPKAD